MDGDPHVHIALELDPQAQPIAGRLLGADGTVREFVGWLELTQALEAEAQRSAATHRSGKDH
jgi:hypothetical protein